MTISTVALCAAHPVRVTTIVCLPAESRSTNAGVLPTNAPSTHTSAASGSVVTNAPPCAGSCAGGGDGVATANVTASNASAYANTPHLLGPGYATHPAKAPTPCQPLQSLPSLVVPT